MDKKSWKKLVPKKRKPWKIDEYSGIEGEKTHNHKTISGAVLIKGELVGGDIYYHRKDGKVVINLDERGKSLI